MSLSHLGRAIKCSRGPDSISDRGIILASEAGRSAGFELGLDPAVRRRAVGKYRPLGNRYRSFWGANSLHSTGLDLVSTWSGSSILHLRANGRLDKCLSCCCMATAKIRSPWMRSRTNSSVRPWRCYYGVRLRRRAVVNRTRRRFRPWRASRRIIPHPSPGALGPACRLRRRCAHAPAGARLGRSRGWRMVSRMERFRHIGISNGRCDRRHFE
jgi:hypothetical protein